MKDIKVVILAGGFGTRLAEETDRKPKPMVEVGGYPLLWHIIRLYATQGLREFIIALGYKGEVIKRYFQKPDKALRNLKITLVDTGLNSGTGGRLKKLKEFLGGKTFMMTYGDGLSNVDLHKLFQFHRRHGKLATVTAVRPPARFGSLKIKGELVAKFAEKPQVLEGWINGGFFVLESSVLDYIHNDQIMFEQGPLGLLAEKQQLMAYKHKDFWQCVDTLRDLRFLEQLWRQKKAPWKIWKS